MQIKCINVEVIIMVTRTYTVHKNIISNEKEIFSYE